MGNVEQQKKEYSQQECRRFAQMGSKEVGRGGGAKVDRKMSGCGMFKGSGLPLSKLLGGHVRIVTT